MIFNALSRRVTQLSQTVSLRTLLAALFVLQVVIGVGVAEWLSFQNGQKAVNQIARQWLTEVSERVESNLNTFLATPPLVNQLSANAIVRENLDVRNLRTLETLLWQNLLSFDAVNAIAFGNATGEYTALTRLVSPEGELTYTIERADADTNGQLIRETIDAEEQLFERINLATYYDTRQLPWFQAAIWARGPVWSPVFLKFNGTRIAPAIAAVQPVHRPNFTLQGVAAIFLNLQDISTFLQRLPLSQSGEIFILEPTGELIATSSEEDLLVREVRNTRRRFAAESQNSVIQTVANTIGDLQTLQTSRQLQFKLGRDRYFVQLTPYGDPRGLNWLVGVAVPESDFLGPLQTYKQTALQVALVAIAIAIIIGILTASWIAQPIQQLSQAALLLPQGTHLSLPTVRTIEVRRLVKAFNQMARQLQQSFNELEVRVEERTAQLRDANQLLTSEVLERQRSEQTLRQTEAMNRSLLQAIPDLMMRVREDGIFLDFWPSKRIESVVETHLVVGKSVFEVLPKEVAQGRLEAVQRAIASGETQYHEYQIEFPGEIRYEESRIVPCGKDQALVMVRDITDRKHAEAALRLSEEKYSKAFLSSPEYVTISTVCDGRYIEANDSFLHAFGYTRAEVIGQNALDLGIWLQPERRLQMRQLLETQGSLRNMEANLRRKSGEVLIVLISAEIIELGREACVLAVMQDITERKQAEMALQYRLEIEHLVTTISANFINQPPEQVDEAIAIALQAISEFTQVDRSYAIAWSGEPQLEANTLRKTHQWQTPDFPLPQELANRWHELELDWALTQLKRLEILHIPQVEELPPEAKGFQESLQSQGIQSLIWVPMICEGKNTGFLGFETVRSPHRWADEDRALLQIVAEILTNALTRKQAQEALQQFAQREALLNRLASAIRNSLDLEMILETAVHEMRQLLGGESRSNRAFFAWFRSNELQPYWEVVKESKTEGLRSFVGCYPFFITTENPEIFLENLSIYLNILRVNDISQIGDPVARRFYQDLGFQALLSVSIHTHSGQIGSIGFVECDRPRIWSSSEVELLQAVADQLAIAISQAELYEEARSAQAQSERLLLNILPEAIAERLKQEEHNIADSFEEATVLFSDIVGFTQISARISPTELVKLLNEIFSTFDRLAEKHGLEKIKTIGDAYMVVGGIPNRQRDSAAAVAQMALDMQTAIQRFKQDNGEPFSIRIGINSGPVVAGVIGLRKFIYDLWGDTVNVASRMESQALPGSIQVTEIIYQRLCDRFVFEKRGTIPIKGRGEMVTYLLKGRLDSMY
ncbi:MAG: PAS domain S-box protein [Desertifilum sp. SIO1I2]|nr:PAS domain S-box protein [Desertifilum sp. SIO1I2]